MVMRKYIALAILAAVVVVGWLLWQQQRPQPLIVSGFIEADQVRVGSRVGGRVAKVLVAEGQMVSKAQPLFQIEPFDLQQRMAQAEGELAAAQAEHARLTAGFRPEEIAQAQGKRDRAEAILARLEAGPRPREIEIAQQKLQGAQANLELAEAELKRMTPLARAGSTSQSELDRSTREAKVAQTQWQVAEKELALLQEGTRKEEIAEAKAALADAQGALKLVQTGYRQEDIAQAQARVQAASAMVAQIHTLMDELTVSAPTDCIVEAIDLRPGDLVGANAPAVSLLETSKLWVRTYVPEGKLAQVKSGARVPIRIDGFPRERFEGIITFIATDAEFTPRNIQTPEERNKQVFRLKITLPNPGGKLRVGMMADVLLDEIS